jgi:hypothetical protein
MLPLLAMLLLLPPAASIGVNGQKDEHEQGKEEQEEEPEKDEDKCTWVSHDCDDRARRRW